MQGKSISLSSPGLPNDLGPRIGRAAKRAGDLTAAGLLLAVLSPLFMIIALAIRLESRGPAIFRQLRVGRHFCPFVLLKFRTMRGDDDNLAEGAVLDSRDPRITRIGRLLRASGLDELPQLINVLRGDMSLVGPRPLIEWEARACLECHALRFAVLPGITGLQQVEVRNAVGLSERSDLDVAYIRTWSLPGDLALMLRTLAMLIAGKGVYESESGDAGAASAE